MEKWSGPQSSGSQSTVPGGTEPASPAGLVEMQVLGPDPRPTEAETLGVGPSHLYLNEPLPPPQRNNSDARLKAEYH